jgi:hypothetical protein
VRFRPEPGIELSGRFLLPREPAKRAVLWVAEGGIEAAEERIRAAARVAAVLAIDPRGIEVPEEMARLADYAFLLGHPFLGRQLTDVLAAIRLLKEWPETQALPLTLHGTGLGGILVVMAAALSPDVDSVEMEGALLSYRAHLRAPQPETSPARFLPGVLPGCDLPLIAGAVAPCSFVLMAPVDANGAPSTLDAAAAEYQLTGRLFTALGAQGRFLIDTGSFKREP